MSAFLFKISKRSSVPLRMVLVLFVTIFGVFVFTVCIKQITIENKSNNIALTTEKERSHCNLHASAQEELPQIHFPQPKTYSRGECSCNPVRFFVLFSMQRSGSGWFETLLNSHPNISSHGEIFSVKERRINISSIIKTLDSVYNLDWFSSASKNECVAAVGFKWMLNQGVFDNHKEILDYFNLKGVSVTFLFRRNLLRRLISVLANDYDRHAKQLNGIHKSHVHTKQEAEVLAQFKPVINTTALIANLRSVERTMTDCLLLFRSTHHKILYYEDIVKNHKELVQIQEFLGVPVRKLLSRQVKIHLRPPSEQIMNWKDVYIMLNGTQYEHFLHQADYAN
ncbi:P-loop containing nucleoside triphosphate hydrolase protein [Dioscorea alata]|uniref:P-loop containing nucleoside triphosphate hydrolase protein n=4 Tax=Dioscorea alata TaxID=55571 RepID=A0ACB7V2G0_DIOAL|nr:P-loop containing nucleoside triphosphate hydrolase protein [Dioscorea alata]KAH7667257.1 P-loop containing nucleoside triphosphate hydrolase protein [Dioscorea alata]